MSATRITTLTLTGSGEPERLPAQMISASMFPLLGKSAHLGRTFTPEEDRAGGAPVVRAELRLLATPFRRLARSMGKSVTLDNQRYTVIGVLPRVSVIGSLQHLLHSLRAVGQNAPRRSQLASRNLPPVSGARQESRSRKPSRK